MAKLGRPYRLWHVWKLDVATQEWSLQAEDLREPTAHGMATRLNNACRNGALYAAALDGEEPSLHEQEEWEQRETDWPKLAREILDGDEDALRTRVAHLVEP